MNIGIDIDDTISKTNEEIDVWAREYTEKILNRKFEMKKVEILDQMWAKHLYGWSIEEDEKFWDLYYEKIMNNVKPKNDAQDVINRLAENNNIIIITARWDRESGIISNITKDWLKKYNIHYNKLYIGSANKTKIVKENDIEVFIDDSFKNCSEISEMNVKTFLMNSRINENMKLEKIERVYSWIDIQNKLIK